MSKPSKTAKPRRNAKRAPEKKGKKIGRPTGTTRFNTDQVAAALKATGGIFSHAAAWLARAYSRPCSRQAVQNYVNKSERLQNLIVQINEVQLDDSEARLNAFIRNGSERSLHFYLATKGKGRGYTRRIEATGKDGAPLAPEVDLSGVPLDKLRNLEALLGEIDAAGRADA